MKRDVILLLAGAILGVVAWLFVQRPIEKYLAQREKPEQLLSEADTLRGGLTEADLTAATEKYEAASAKAANLKSQAYWGLSRTYADLATLRNWRGLSRSDYPDKAQSYALKALAVAKDAPETDLVLAYAYESSEADQLNEPATKKKILELVARQQDNLEIEYLRWLSRADEQAKSFPATINPDSISNVRILIDLAMHYVESAEAAPSDTDRQPSIQRAEQFLNRASSLSPNNSLVLFGRGYLAAVRGNMPAARDYYEKALSRDTEFPRARNNLGFTYATEGNYQLATQHFEMALLTVGAPSRSQRIWLHNLGEAAFEIPNYEKACQAWSQAAEVPGATEDWNTFLGLAYCSYANQQMAVSTEYYRRSIALAKTERIDLTKRDTIQSWKPGANELKAADALIEMTSHK